MGQESHQCLESAYGAYPGHTTGRCHLRRNVALNTHDCGGLLTIEAVVQLCRDHGYDLVAELRARGLGPEALCPRPEEKTKFFETPTPQETTS